MPAHPPSSIAVLALLFILLPHPSGGESLDRTHLNQSLEQPDGAGSGPLGWTYTGPEEARASAWTAETPADGSRALRLSGLSGSQRWTSPPFGVEADRTYLLEWLARYRGEKAWRFRAEFSGVEIEFLNRSGASLGASRSHTHCWQTHGWRPGWVLFDTPPDCASIQASFALVTHEPLPGGFDVDSLRLEPYPGEDPVPAGQQRVLLHSRDELGQPTVARIHLASVTDGATHGPRRGAPRGCIAYGMASDSFHPPRDGLIELILPKGAHQITVTKGFEYEPWTQRFEVTGNSRAGLPIEVNLTRKWNWPARGWFCGDHHTHLYRHGGSLFTSLTWKDILRVARAEGLDFLPFMGADRYPDGVRFPDAEGIVAELSEEITEDFWGHVCPIGVPANSRDDPRFEDGPMHLDRDAAIRGEGGVLCFGHPYGPLEEGREFGALASLSSHLPGREFPIDLALGARCAVDLLTQEGSRNQLDLKLRDLYRLWNLGLRPTLSASTDFHVDQGRQPIGAVRTYVHPKKRDMQSIARAYREGKTFVTNGPLLDLRVGGEGPGATVPVAGGAVVSITCEAASLGPLDRLELVANGQVLRAFMAHGADHLRVSEDTPLAGSAWIAARVTGPECPFFASELEGRPLGQGQFAHTSPVYVLVDGKDVLAASPEDADYFVGWCDAVERAWNSHLEVSPESRAQDALARERIAAARKRFTKLQERVSARKIPK
ncbi:MAG: CehA/McbA family metallohydrolase [Candidatus Omnitrophica bacterium]|nr:hypothetical protein [bacterium]NUN95078.1 CehA/McbA family metallohydrolase [Candidatus Omnitrophota bacterium]